MYVYAAVGIFVVLGAFFWFVFHMIFWMIQPVAESLTYRFETNSTQWTNVDTFFQAYDAWALIIALLVMMVFAFVYSQRRGQQV
jgi:hypothetical protein